MAEILAGASTGSSTLADCHSALLQALADENKNYFRYRADRAPVPVAFEKIDRQITENHTNAVAGLKTTLSYWQTGDLDSISLGTNQYKASIQKENATITEMNQVMQDEAR